MLKKANLSDRVVENIERKYKKQLNSGRPLEPLAMLISEIEHLDLDDVREYILSRNSESEDIEVDSVDVDIDDEAGFIPNSDIGGLLKLVLKYKYTGVNSLDNLVRNVDELNDAPPNGIFAVIKDLSKNLILTLCGKVERGIQFDDYLVVNDYIISVSSKLNKIFGENHSLPSQKDRIFPESVLKRHHDNLKGIEDKVLDISKKFDAEVTKFNPKNTGSIKNVAVLISNLMVQLGRMKTEIASIKHIEDKIQLTKENLGRDEIQESIDTYKERRDRISIPDFKKRIKHNLDVGLGTDKQKEEMRAIIEDIDKNSGKDLVFGTQGIRIKEKIDLKEYSLISLLSGDKFVYQTDGGKKEINLNKKLVGISYNIPGSRVDKEGEQKAQAILGDVRFRRYINDFKNDVYRHASEYGDEAKTGLVIKRMVERVYELLDLMGTKSWVLPLEDVKSEGERNLIEVLSGRNKFSPEKMEVISSIGQDILRIENRDGQRVAVINVDGDDYLSEVEKRIDELKDKMEDVLDQVNKDIKPVKFGFKVGGDRVSVFVDVDFLGEKLDKLSDDILIKSGLKPDSVRSMERAEGKKIKDQLKNRPEIVTYYRLEESGKKWLNTIKELVFKHVDNELGKRPSTLDEAINLMDKAGYSKDGTDENGKILRKAILAKIVDSITGEDGGSGIPKNRLNNSQVNVIEKLGGYVFEEDGPLIEKKLVTSPEQESIRDAGEVTKEIENLLGMVGITVTNEIKSEIKRNLVSSSQSGIPRDSFINDFVKFHIVHSLSRGDDVMGVNSLINKIIEEIELRYFNGNIPDDSKETIKEMTLKELKMAVEKSKSIDDIVGFLKDNRGYIDSMVKNSVERLTGINDDDGEDIQVSKTASGLVRRYLLAR